jgi:hypothetical protein
MIALDLDRRLGAMARLTAEYRDLPGLRLTTAQAARLCELSVRETGMVLTTLVASGYLCCDRSGRYLRVDVDAQRCDAGSVAVAIA